MDEEEKRRESGEAVKPKKFTGRINLKNTGAQDDEDKTAGGVTKDYSFGVVYKQPFVEGERREGGNRNAEDRGEGRGGFGGYKGKRDRGTAFGAKKEGPAENEDEGFEVVRNKTRVQKTFKKNADGEDSSDEETSDIKPKHYEGNRGGRGFFRSDRGDDRGGSRGGSGERGSFRRSEGEAVRGARVERGGNRGDRGGFRSNATNE